MIDFSNYEVFIFDCDGVILDSNELKSEAFAYALSAEDKSDVEKLIKYHKDNGGISRYEKFEYFYSEICPSSQKDLNVKKAIEAFAEKVSKEMLRVDLIPGILEFLKKIRFLNKKIFVNSGSDETELNEIFESRNLAVYFDRIFGSPCNKVQNLHRISKFNNKGDRAIFFGDSVSDFIASQRFGMEFVFISGHSEWECADSAIEYEFSDFSEILRVQSKF